MLGVEMYTVEVSAIYLDRCLIDTDFNTELSNYLCYLVNYPQKLSTVLMTQTQMTANRTQIM